MKTILTISGIRPDFIRMSEIFKKLDENFNHILVHSGQHYDALLSDVFFNDLKIRKPDFNLCIGAHGKKHYQQVSDLSIGIIELIENEKSGMLIEYDGIRELEGEKIYITNYFPFQNIDN
jgi:UDP-N-acetylglucosamine 2-epimerase